MIEYIENNSEVYALIVRNSLSVNGAKFLTPNEYELQVAIMSWPKNHKIIPHLHKSIERRLTGTSEVLIVKKGLIKVTFFDDDKLPVARATLSSGDIILLRKGGHGFEMLEDSEFIEVKQGPYIGELDKVRFIHI